MKYVELCAGIGGTRAGLDASGWECLLAVDIDPDAVAVHRLAHGACAHADLADLNPDDLPPADALVAGFPCQPFSSSGHRTGFNHRSGSVFEHVLRIVAQTSPPLVLLENVQGLLYNKSGHTFARILLSLTSLGYSVDWLLVDLRWFGWPQTRPRVLVLATRGTERARKRRRRVAPGSMESAFRPLIDSVGGRVVREQAGNLIDVEESRRPAIGKAKPAGAMPFAAGGRAVGTHFTAWRTVVSEPTPLHATLGSVVAPAFSDPMEIKSARYWAYDGPSSLHLRHEPVSHCVGTSLGGAPLFAVPLSLVKSPNARQAFLEYANWHREEDGHLVMRLQPERTARLFGPHTEALESALLAFQVGSARKYVLVGNMVPPVCASALGDAAIAAHAADELQREITA